MSSFQLPNGASCDQSSSYSDCEVITLTQEQLEGLLQKIETLEEKLEQTGLVASSVTSSQVLQTRAIEYPAWIAMVYSLIFSRSPAEKHYLSLTRWIKYPFATMRFSPTETKEINRMIEAVFGAKTVDVIIPTLSEHMQLKGRGEPESKLLWTNKPSDTINVTFTGVSYGKLTVDDLARISKICKYHEYSAIDSLRYNANLVTDF